MQKYKIEDFEWTILEECNNELLNEREIYWIKEKNTHFKEGYGYNMTFGGKGGPGVGKKKVRIYKLQYLKNGDFNKIFVKDCESILATKNFLIEEEGTPENSFAESGIASICKGKKFSLHGYTFCFLDENNEEIPTNYVFQDSTMKNTTKYNQAICKAIKIINKFGEEVGAYPSISSASRDTGISEDAFRRSIDKNVFISQGKGTGLKVILLSQEEAKERNLLLSKSNRITPEMIDKINEVYAETHNQKETARILDISRYSVMRHLRR